MNTFLKAIAGTLTALILWLSLNKNNKDISVLLTLAVSAMVLTISISFLQPIVNFITKVQVLGNLDKELLSVVLKVVGIGLLTEIATMICKDAGNETMGKSMQILSAIVVIWMSIPVFEKLLSLMDKILGTV